LIEIGGYSQALVQRVTRQVFVILTGLLRGFCLGFITHPLKNIYAIVTGMAAALGCGNNTQAMLLTRSLAEMSRFAKELGANPMTFLGLAGVGDLILTCTSDLSRNYRVGFAIGTGKSLDEAVAEIGQVAEGVNTLQIVKRKADELDVYMPLVTGLYNVLFAQTPVAQVAAGLMQGEQNYDVEFTVKSP